MPHQPPNFACVRASQLEQLIGIVTHSHTLHTPFKGISGKADRRSVIADAHLCQQALPDSMLHMNTLLHSKPSRELAESHWWPCCLISIDGSSEYTARKPET